MLQPAMKEILKAAAGHRLEIILNREPVLLDKCLLPAQSAYSLVVDLA